MILRMKKIYKKAKKRTNMLGIVVDLQFSVSVVRGNS